MVIDVDVDDDEVFVLAIDESVDDVEKLVSAFVSHRDRLVVGVDLMVSEASVDVADEHGSVVVALSPAFAVSFLAARLR